MPAFQSAQFAAVVCRSALGRGRERLLEKCCTFVANARQRQCGLRTQFYNLAIFMSSIAVFSLVAQRMASAKVVGS